MSIQIIVTSPYHFFSDGILHKKAKNKTTEFINLIKRELNIKLLNPWVDEEYYCEDLPCWTDDKLQEILYYSGLIEIRNIFSASLYLPYEFKSKTFNIKPYAKDGPCSVVSVEHLLIAIEEISLFLAQSDEYKDIDLEDCKHEDFIELLNYYKEAAEIAILKQQLIMFSW